MGRAATAAAAAELALGSGAGGAEGTRRGEASRRLRPSSVSVSVSNLTHFLISISVFLHSLCCFVISRCSFLASRWHSRFHFFACCSGVSAVAPKAHPAQDAICENDGLCPSLPLARRGRPLPLPLLALFCASTTVEVAAVSSFIVSASRSFLRDEGRGSRVEGGGSSTARSRAPPRARGRIEQRNVI